MADPFEGIRIEDAAGNQVDLRYLRQRFGEGLTGTWDRSFWELRKIYLPEGAMTTWVSFQDFRGNPIPDQEATWSWPDGSHRELSDGGGRSNWVIGNDIWIDGGKTSGQENHYVGPYVVKGTGFEFKGIGWAAGTNHMKPAFYLVKPGGTPPPAPGGPGNGVDRAAIEQKLGGVLARTFEIEKIVDEIAKMLK